VVPVSVVGGFRAELISSMWRSWAAVSSEGILYIGILKNKKATTRHISIIQ